MAWLGARLRWGVLPVAGATVAAYFVFGGALALLAAAAAWAACAQFRFYPTIGGLAPWWNYLPYALFACLPLAITAKEHLRWRA